MKRFRSEADILAIVRGFESGKIRREDWHHAEHLTVALYYLWHHDFDFALTRMRDGIFNLLEALKVDLTKEMPYHETLTVFWLWTISDLIKNRNGDSLLDATNRILEIGDKDLPLKFYSRELLFSDEARKNFVTGDL